MDIKKRYTVSPQNMMMTGEDVMIINTEDSVIVLEKFELSLLNELDGRRTLEDISDGLSKKYLQTYVEQEFYDFIFELFHLGIIEQLDEN